jgi:hypothetical protein
VTKIVTTETTKTKATTETIVTIATTATIVTSRAENIIDRK